MVRSRGPSAAELTGRSKRYMTQIIFYAGKTHLIKQCHLRQIGSKTHFGDLVIAVSQKEPKKMRLVLENALDACTGSEKTFLAGKTARKRKIDEQIEKCSKSQRHPESLTAGSTEADTPTKRDKARPSLLADTGTDEWGQALPRCSENGDEHPANEEEEDDNDEDVSEDESAEISQNSAPPSKYARQRRLIRGEPLCIDDDECRKNIALRHIPKRIFVIDTELQDLFSKGVMLFDPELVKENLTELLENQIETASTADLPTISKSSSPVAILNAWCYYNRVSEDVGIRGTGAELMLYSAVESRCRPGGHIEVLRGLSTEAAGDVSSNKSKKVFNDFKTAYKHGRRWNDLSNMFGGEGIIILLFAAGVSKCFITDEMTEFQRDCLAHFAPHLYSIKKLVEALGPNPLETYLSRGCLSKATVDEIEHLNLFEE